MAAGIGFVEVSGVAVYGVNHVAFAICDDGRLLGSNIVQELLQSRHCVHRGCICCDSSVLRAVRMELSTPHPYQRSVSRTC
jgi:hypothetical protein